MIKVMAPNKFVPICSDDSPLGGQVEPKSIKKQKIFVRDLYFYTTVLSVCLQEYRLTEFQSHMTYMRSMCQTQCNKQTKRDNNKNSKRNKISLHFILLK